MRLDPLYEPPNFCDWGGQWSEEQKAELTPETQLQVH